MARNDTMKYREYYVHGSAAYNRHVEPSEIVRDEPIYVPARKRIEETVAANTEALTRQSLSPMVLLGFVVAIVMLVLVLWPASSLQHWLPRPRNCSLRSMS